MSSVTESPVKKPRAVRAPRVRKVSQQVNDLIAKPSKIKDLLTAKQGPGVKIKTKVAELRVSYGSDPELFAVRAADGKIVSSIPILKRDKHDPIDLGNGVVVFADNAAVECSIRPSNTKAEMIEGLRDAFQRMQTHMGPEYRLLPQAAHTFGDGDLEVLEVVSEDGVKRTLSPFEVGCSVSYDAHTVSICQPSQFTDGMRSGSFHLHLGNRDWQGDHDGRLLSFNARHETVKLMDLYVGLPSVLMGQDPSAATRRIRYGTASNFRPTPYGLEYRVLDNYPLRSPVLTDLTLDLVDHALSFVREGTGPDALALVDFEAVRAAINTCDKDAAASLLAQLKVPAGLMARVTVDRGELDMYQEWGIKV